MGAATSDFFRPPVEGGRPRELHRAELPRITRPFLLTVSAWLPHKNTELLLEAFARSAPRPSRSLQLVVACTLPLEGLIRWEAHGSRRALPRRGRVHRVRVRRRAARAVPDDRAVRVPVALRGIRAAGPRGGPLRVARDHLEPCPAPRGARLGAGDVRSRRRRRAGGVDRAWPDRHRVPIRAARAGGRRRAPPHVGPSRATDAGRLRAGRGAAGPAPAPRSSRLRMALVGPFPPVRSGVARYNLAVADRLAQRLRPRLLRRRLRLGPRRHRPRAAFTPGSGRRPRRRLCSSAAGWFPARSLGRTIDPARYDAVVYTIGNSWFHHDTLAVARRYPGIAGSTTSISSACTSRTRHRLLADDPPAALTLFRELLARYGSRVPGLTVSIDDRRWAAYEPYRRSGLRLTAELACDSRRSIVTSQRAQTLLEHDAGPVPLAPIEVMPLAVPNRRPAAQSDRPSTPPVIVTLGREDDAKQREADRRRIAILNRERQVRLAVVGQIRPDHVDRLVRRIDARGVGDVVDVTGFVTDREYHEWIETATSAVQLRLAQQRRGLGRRRRRLRRRPPGHHEHRVVASSCPTARWRTCRLRPTPARSPARSRTRPR